jgi:hypothetical protein
MQVFVISEYWCEVINDNFSIQKPNYNMISEHLITHNLLLIIEDLI